MSARYLFLASPSCSINYGGSISKTQNSTESKHKRHGQPVERTHRARRTVERAAPPSSSNTREIKSDHFTPPAVGSGNEIWTTDGTERGTLATDGKRPILTLIPIPLDAASPDVAHNDWIAFSFTPVENERDSIAHLLVQLAMLLGLPCIPAAPTGGGWNGYKTRYNLSNGNDVSLGLIAAGGKQQRGTVHVELNAHACALVKDFHAFAAWGESIQAKITRIDLAHDDLEGSSVNIEIAKVWFEQGLFTSTGRSPKGRLYDDMGTGEGKTLYIGKREHGKMLRIYEKGKQLGDKSSQWVRVELELRNKNRFIPWGVLSSPGKYLAGSYRCLHFLSIIQEKIRTIKKAAKISFARSVEHARLMVGKLVNVMMIVAGGDAFQVIGELKRDGYPARLKDYADYLPQEFEVNHAALVT